MKRTLIIAVLLSATLTSADAQDWSKWGLKGNVQKAEIETSNLDRNDGTLKFTTEGTVQQLLVETPWITVMSDEFSTTKNGYSSSQHFNLNITIKQGRIATSDIVETIRGITHHYTTAYTYGTNGFLEKMTGTHSWTTTRTEYVEQTASMNRNVARAKELQEQIKQARTDAERQRLTAEYQRVVSGAGVNTSGGNTREVKENHSESFSRTYYNYKTDDLGNWTSRSFRTEASTTTYVQKQTITYEPEFLSDYRWVQLPKTDLAKVEKFAQDKNITATYRKKASDYWNNNILNELNAKSAEDMDKYCAAAYSSIASKETKEKALDYVQSTIYNSRVVPERDYAKVKQMASMRWDGYLIFNTDYFKRIEDKSLQLYNDSLAGLKQQAQTAYDANDFAEVRVLTDRIKAIDSNNEFAKTLRAEVDYRFLQSKENANIVNQQDYMDFLQANPGSAYDGEVKDKYANLAIKNAKGYRASSEVAEWVKQNRYSYYDKAKRKVDREYFKAFRGKFVHFGFSGDFNMGGANFGFGGGVHARFGYNLSWINLEVGAKYTYLNSTKGETGRDDDLQGGYFMRQYLSVPVDLHINLTHDDEYAWYLGVGAELAVSNLSANFKEKKPTTQSKKDKKIGNQDMLISPKLSVGYTKNTLEVELYGLYDMDSQFNVDYVTPVYGTISDPKIFEQQVSDQKLFDKLRLGLSFKFLF